MSTEHPGFRPPEVGFDHLGASVVIVDPAALFTAARTAAIQVLQSGELPVFVLAAEVLVGSNTHSGRPVHTLTARIDLRPVAPVVADAVRARQQAIARAAAAALAARAPIPAAIAFGTAYLVGKALNRHRANRSPTVPNADGPRIDAATGLQVTLNETTSDSSTRVITLEACFYQQDTDTHGVLYLSGFMRVVLSVLSEHSQALRPQVGELPLAGHTYVLSVHPGGRWLDPSEPLSLDNVGGLDNVVAHMREVVLSFQHPDTMRKWGANRPQGILLYGPPGTGKTMLAKALAHEIGADLTEIQTSDIMAKYLGESEANIKRIFLEAKTRTRPTVLLFDEFDTIIGYATGPGGAADRAVTSVAGIFKQEMNTLITENPNVIVVATTNYLTTIDDSLIRSGRFNLKLEVPLPDTPSRHMIFVKVIKVLITTLEKPGFRLFAGDVDLTELAAVTEGLTGADIKEVLRRIQQAKAVQEARTGHASAPITQEEIIEEIRRMHPR